MIRAQDRQRGLLLAALAIAMVLRIGVVFYLGAGIGDIRGGTADQVSYDMLGQRLSTGYGFSFPTDWWPYARADQPTAFWSYLYSLYLGAVYVLFGHNPIVARLIQVIVVAVATPLMLYRLGSRAFGGKVGLLAAAVSAVYLYFVVYAASLMTEAFYITGILWATDAAFRLDDRLKAGGRPWPAAVEFGVVVGATIMLRQLVVVYFAPLGLWLLIRSIQRGQARRMTLAFVLSTAVVLLFVSPILVRNQRVFGSATLLNTNAGFTLFWSNHPIYGTHFEATLSPAHGVSYQDLIPPELRNLNEAQLDRALLRRAIAFVLSDPGRFVRLSLSRIPVYFIFWPTSDSTLLSNLSRVLSFGLFLPVMLYGLVRVAWVYLRGGATQRARVRWDAVGVFWLFIVLYTGLHLISWANVRYRLPVDAFLIIFAAFGLCDLYERIRRPAVETASRGYIGIQ